MTDAARSDRTLILGIGNILWADEGFGVRAVEELHRRYAFPGRVRVMDGGTQGLYLVQYVAAVENLLVFDAVDYGRTPGAMMVWRGEDVPRFTGCKKMSLHQTGFQDVLSAGLLMGKSPRRLTLIGVHAADLETWGGTLSPPVRQCIDPAVDLALAELRSWGVVAEQRDRPLDPRRDGLLGNGLDLSGYDRAGDAAYDRWEE